MIPPFHSLKTSRLSYRGYYVGPFLVRKCTYAQRTHTYTWYIYIIRKNYFLHTESWAQNSLSLPGESRAPWMVTVRFCTCGIIFSRFWNNYGISTLLSVDVVAQVWPLVASSDKFRLVFYEFASIFRKTQIYSDFFQMLRKNCWQCNM